MPGKREIALVSVALMSAGIAFVLIGMAFSFEMATNILLGFIGMVWVALLTAVAISSLAVIEEGTVDARDTIIHVLLAVVAIGLFVAYWVYLVKQVGSGVNGWAVAPLLLLAMCSIFSTCWGYCLVVAHGPLLPTRSARILREEYLAD